MNEGKPQQNREKALWQQFAPERADTGKYNLENPEILNALAAYADGNENDPGRARIEKSLSQNDEALDDLLFLRNGAGDEPLPLPEDVIEKACALVPEAQHRKKQHPGWVGGTSNDGQILARPWAVGIALAGLLSVSALSFHLGTGIRQQQVAIEELTLSVLPLVSGGEIAPGLTTMGGRR